MTNLFLIVLIALIVSCNSKISDKEAIPGDKKKDTISKSTILNKVEQNRDSSVIYDTLVFTDNMRGEALNDKFASCLPELKFYKKFISSKKINELISLKKEDVKTEIKYLGAPVHIHVICSKITTGKK